MPGSPVALRVFDRWGSREWIVKRIVSRRYSSLPVLAVFDLDCVWLVHELGDILAQSVLSNVQSLIKAATVEMNCESSQKERACYVVPEVGRKS